MRVIIGGDGAGQPLVEVLAAHLRARGVAFEDASAKENMAEEKYATTAERVALGVRDGGFARGVLCCGTGIGVCIAANKVPGIRAALTHDTYSAERAAKSNDAQIITMGARVIGPELAKAILDTYLAASFDPQSHSAPNVNAINQLDQKYHDT